MKPRGARRRQTVGSQLSHQSMALEVRMLPSANPINTPLVQDVTLSNVTISENQSAGAAIGTLGLTNAADGPVQFKLIHGEGSSGNSRFRISEGQLVAKSSLNFEQQSSYSVRVQAKDAAGNVSVHVFSIQVQDINEGVTGIALVASPLQENSAIGTLAGTLSALDQDSGETFTYTLVSGDGSTDNALFSIAGDSLETAANLDYETKSTYSVRVRATDAGGLSYERVIAIKITNINEPLPVTLSSSTVAENQPAGTVVGTLGLTGAPDGPLQYKLVSGTGSDGNAKFKIVGNQLVTKSTLNFEGESSYSVRVQVKDSGGNISTEVFTIAVTDANDAVTGIGFDAANLAEDAAIGTTAGTLSAVDQDSSDTWTYTLVAGKGATDNASFTIAGDTIKTAATLDFETKATYSVRVRATDSGGLSYERVIQIRVTNANEFTVNLSNNEVDENQAAGTVVGTLSVTNPPIGALQYKLVSGEGSEGNSRFRISGDRLVTKATLNAEQQSSYSVRVQVTDGNGDISIQVFTISVNDVNEAVTGISFTASPLAEDAAVGTVAGTLSATDRDAADTFTYTLVSGDGSMDNAQFTIAGDSIKTAAALDSETKSTYSVRVRATDAGGLFFERVITIRVSNVNEAPTAIALSNTTVLQNKPPGWTVGKLTAVDPDANSQLQFTLVEGAVDNAQFQIEGSTLKTNVVFDIGIQTSSTVRVQVTDAGGLSFVQDFTIGVI